MPPGQGCPEARGSDRRVLTGRRYNTPVMLVLGIETSCDETAAAVVEDGALVLSNVISTQVEIHARYGGVVPEVASRQHMLQIVPVVDLALEKAQVGWDDIDAIAVTKGPGLAGSLLVGVSMAKALALAHELPLLGVNHLEGHVYANWLVKEGPKDAGPELPCLCLIASGGHTDLVLMRDHGDYLLLGRTRDDAAGESFDKVARVLGLGYPGGPVVERVARKGSQPKNFPRAWLKGSDDFSFSGLKTAVIRASREMGSGRGQHRRPGGYHRPRPPASRRRRRVSGSRGGRAGREDRPCGQTRRRAQCPPLGWGCGQRRPSFGHDRRAAQWIRVARRPSSAPTTLQ